LFPKCEERGVSIVVGAPYNSGYLAGKNRYNYKSGVPDEIKKKGDRIGAIAKEYGTDLRTAALQFCNAPSVVSAVIPGASCGAQVIENALSIAMKIPSDFWQTLKRDKLIAESAATPN
jgi:D-threo-aldose 1-dehydrogenase